MHEPHDPKGPPAPERPARRLSGAVAGVSVVVVVVVWTVLGLVPAASAAGATVNVATTATFGTVLTDAQGFALYTFSMDQGGMSNCTGSCLTVWPALTVPAGTTPTAGPGVTGTVAAVVQANGTSQVTYNGAPLYTFVTDTAGQVTGNGVGGFSVVKVAAPPTPTTVPPTTPPTTAAPATPTTPTTRPASTNPTGTGPTPTAAVTAPAVAPAVSPSAASSATTAPGSSGPVPAGSAPTALAVTGPGPALMWMVIVGAALVALSLGILVGVGANGVGRGARRAATRAGSWLLGR